MTQVKQNTKSAITTSFIAQLDVLAARHTVFQIDYDAVNKTLFELLADCLSLYNKYQAAADAQESIVKAIKEILIARNMTIGKHVTTLSLIVRYVFNIENKRANRYVRALSVAINSKIAATDFAGWVEQEGGLDEVVSQKSFTQQTLKNRADIAYKVTQVKKDLNLSLSQPLAVIPESHLIDLANIPTYTMLLGKTMTDGTTHVLSIVPNTTEGMWTAALDKIAKAEMAYEQKLEIELLQASNDALNNLAEESDETSIDLSDFLKAA
jgi:hypothetical protein